MTVVLIVVLFLAWIGLVLYDGTKVLRKDGSHDEWDELSEELYLLEDDPHLLEDDD